MECGESVPLQDIHKAAGSGPPQKLTSRLNRTKIGSKTLSNKSPGYHTPHYSKNRLSKIFFCTASTTDSDLHVGAFLAAAPLVVGDSVTG